MPRYSLNRPPLKTKVAVERAKKYRVRGYKKWIDPFPIGFGTLPEKILYEALSRRNIPFLYLNDIELIVPEISFDQFFQADFIIPSARTIIEVQGAHWHSMPKTIEADALKHALYIQNGWIPLAWWDFDIIDNINALFAQSPELMAVSHYDGSDKSAEMPVQRRTKTDTSKGIRTLNAKRGQRLQYRKKAASVKVKKTKAFGSYKNAVR